MFDESDGNGKCYVIDLDDATNIPKDPRMYLDKIENDYDIFFTNIRKFGDTHNFDYARDIAYELNSELYKKFQDLRKKYIEGVSSSTASLKISVEELKQREISIVSKLTKSVFLPRDLK
jgi:hypothetical protein